MRFRHRHGKPVGMVVSQAWQGYAARLFLSFGKLSAAEYRLRSGAPGRPHGEVELTNMDSLSDWTLTLASRVLASSDSLPQIRERALQRLEGRRLLSLQIDQVSRSTVLTFSRGVVLRTAPMRNCRERRPHWLLRLGRADWPPVVLKGASSRWEAKSGYD